MTQAQQSVLHLLAFQYLWNGQPEKAQPRDELLLAGAPDAVQLRTGLACAQMQNGAPHAAMLSLAPLTEAPDPVVQLLIGRALSLMGDRTGASEAMQQFCAIRPAWSTPVLVDAQSQEEEKTKSAKGVQKNA